MVCLCSGTLKKGVCDGIRKTVYEDQGEGRMKKLRTVAIGIFLGNVLLHAIFGAILVHGPVLGGFSMLAMLIFALLLYKL